MTHASQHSAPSWVAQFLSLPNDNPYKTIAVTLIVAFVSSVLVSASAVLLKPQQIANREADRRQHVEQIIQQLPDFDGEVSGPNKLTVTARVVNLKTGEFDLSLDPQLYVQRSAVRDPEQSIEIPLQDDVASLKRRAKYAVVYEVAREENVQLIVLQVSGHGFGGTIYGYLGLTEAANTVAGLTFYDHRETPGIGSMIDSPSWKRQWRGKKVWQDGVLMLGVGPTRVMKETPEAAYQVDALTGATWTGMGVTNLLHFWLGDYGFGPYLRNFRQ